MWFVVIIYLVHSKFQRTHHGRGTHNCFSRIVTHMFRYFYMESSHKDSAGGKIKIKLKFLTGFTALSCLLVSTPRTPPPQPTHVR